MGKPFRLRIDNVSQGITGIISSGSISVSDAVKILPAAVNTVISEIIFNGTNINRAEEGQSVELRFATNPAIEVGAIICARDNPVQAADQFEVEIEWHASESMFSGRPYLFEFGSLTVPGSVTNIKYKLSDTDQSQLAATTLETGEQCVATISLNQTIAFTSFEEDQTLGAFLITDPEQVESNTQPIASGKIKFALRRASNIHRQSLDLDRNDHAALKSQKPCVLWLTGLSGSGKSTIANALETALHNQGHHTFLLDGDNVRHGLNRDLGFTNADRVENIRRISEVAKLMSDAGLIVITSFISPFVSERQMARQLMADGEFFEIYIDAPLEVCEERDEKGLYAKARAGQIKNFTGIDSAYEPPLEPEISIDTTSLSPQKAAGLIVEYLKEKERLR